MTGGRVVVLGRTGRNFAARMSGGAAYVLDEDGSFEQRCNMGLVGFDAIEEADAIELHELIEEHHLRTQSPVAARILRAWDEYLPKFVKVMPHDYKRALAELAEAEKHAIEPAESTGGGAGGHGAGRVMGKLGGFLDADRAAARARPRAADRRLPRVRQRVPVEGLRRRAGAAWSAACRSATAAARSATCIPDWNDLVGTAMRWGARRSTSCTPPTTSPGVHRQASARRRARPRACWEIREGDRGCRSSRSRSRSSTARGTRAGVVPQAAGGRSPAARVAVIGAGPAGLAAAQQLAARRPHGDRLRARRGRRRPGPLRRCPDFKIERSG